ncbi:hypothetical protein H2199_004654 [Coniosporium tulheliwenetii]|uniref:Uncharacterized protein n=1 Tax=Coniosporium tulheliwenetii TaxID=3383036 RepID=A0ACC2Z751_9PEZI|nr:hypothetical protein H2199_004654 [Cladosporium sp. JES 115]
MASCSGYKVPRPFNEEPLREWEGVGRPGDKGEDTRMPSEHSQVFAKFAGATAEHVSKAIEAALEAKKSWQDTPFTDRAAVFLRAAELVIGKYRYELIAATMLGQGKNAWQAEIDAAAELADFFRFNASLAQQVYEQQPTLMAQGHHGRTDYRPLEGFVYAVSPFNFTAIGGNLVSAPALMGNVVVWKPSPYSTYASYLVYKILLEAGLPPNVIQFVNGDAEMITKVVFEHPEFAALHFAGSSDIFRSLCGKSGEGIVKKIYRDYPRMVGETSGKNFHLVHSSANVSSAVKHTIRGAFEYAGQKCSACSRLYLPQSQAEDLLDQMKEEMKRVKVGPPDEFENFMGTVIHRNSFDRIKAAIDAANKDEQLERLLGGSYDDSKGLFIQPSVYVAKTLDHDLFNRELFGPVLAVHIYPNTEYGQLLERIDL